MNKLKEEIRTSLTYCLASDIKDFEWEVMINNVQSLIDLALAARNKEIEKIYNDYFSDDIKNLNPKKHYSCGSHLKFKKEIEKLLFNLPSKEE